MLKFFIVLPQISPCTHIIVWYMGLLLFSPITMAQGMDNTVEEEIEMLDVIEITGTGVEQTPRELSFPIPEIQQPLHLDVTEHLSRPELKVIKQIPTPSRILLDQTAKGRNINTPVKPIKTDRPLYPRQARRKGWHGRVILRLKILPNGNVESTTIQQSSGHQLLDDSAIKAAAQWTFQPARNGGFPVSSTVNIPIQFDLLQ